MTEFLCFQISLTMPTQIVPQTLLTEIEAWLILNCEKFDLGSLWITDDTPSHLKHRHQTRQANLQTKNKWQDDSSSSPHKQHKRFSTATPRLTKLILEAILFSNTLQAVNKADGKALHLHNLLSIACIRCLLADACFRIKSLVLWV